MSVSPSPARGSAARGSAAAHGSAAARGPRGARAREHLAALQSALAAEQAASYGYGVVGAHLTGQAYTAAAADCLAHERARDSLTAMITGLAGEPRPAAVAYRLPRTVSTRADAIELAVTIERQVAAAYLSLVAVADPALRAFGAGQMQDSAVRATRWGGHSQAFPGLPASSLKPPT